METRKTFKNWWNLMWKGQWILIFMIFFSALTIQLFFIPECIQCIVEAFRDYDYGEFLRIAGGILTTIGMLIPLSGCSLIGYFIFYQFWNDWLNNRSR